jgi:hypothetical protein
MVLNESAPQVYINMADFLSTAPLETDQPNNESIPPLQPSGALTTPVSAPSGNGIW